MMMNTRFLADANELCRLGVRELTAGFGSGSFTPLEVAQATLARAEQVQERYNAFSLIDVDAPGVIFGFQGFRVTPVKGLSVIERRLGRSRDGR
jgi:hypothetical protein